MKAKKMHGAREYAEEFPVELDKHEGRYIVRAFNEGGCDLTEVDLFDLLEWIKKNKPELLK